MTREQDALRILEDLAMVLQPVRGEDAVLERLYGEVMWLRQEFARGGVPLPLRSTTDVYFPYALSEGLLEDWPGVHDRVEALYDAFFEE